MDEQGFGGWVARMPITVMDLESDIVLRCGVVEFEADFSVESLRVLERVLLDSVPSYDVVWNDEYQWIVEGASVYFGETCIKALGGDWFFDRGEKSVYRGLPVINCPKGTKNVVCPPYVVSAAVRRRNGGFFEGVYRGLAEIGGVSK